MAKDAANTLEELFHAAGWDIISKTDRFYPPGYSIHEVGTCRMGDDPEDQRAEQVEPEPRHQEPVCGGWRRVRHLRLAEPHHDHRLAGHARLGVLRRTDAPAQHMKRWRAGLIAACAAAVLWSAGAQSTNAADRIRYAVAPSSRDRVTLDLWENVTAGFIARRFYRFNPRVVVCRHSFILRGRVRTGRRSLAIWKSWSMRRANWNCRRDYRKSLQRWLPVRPRGAGHRKLEEFGKPEDFA